MASVTVYPAASRGASWECSVQPGDGGRWLCGTGACLRRWKDHPNRTFPEKSHALSLDSEPPITGQVRAQPGSPCFKSRLVSWVIHARALPPRHEGCLLETQRLQAQCQSAVLLFLSVERPCCALKRKCVCESYLAFSPSSLAKEMTNQYSILFKQEQAHDDAIWSVAWGTNKKENSETVVTGSLDDLVKVWKWCDERLDLQWSLEGHQLGVVSVDISHTLPIAASSSLDAHIRLWDLENGKQIKSIDAGPVDAWTLAFSPDSQYLATGTHVGKVNIFGVESGKKEYSLDTRGKFILSIAYSPDGKYLASGAIDGIINIFDIATGKLLHTLEGHAMPIRSLTFSPDSQLLVTASDDGYIKIYDVQHANLAGTLSGHASWVLNVAFCPDDTHFVSSSSDKSVKVWDVGTRTCVHTFFDHQDQVWGVKYNGNGSKIVSVGDDQEIHIYDCPI